MQIYFKNRPYLIGPIVKRLKELKIQVLATLRKSSLRFYSTSLLIVSEGCLASHRNYHLSKHNNSDGEEEEEDEEECEFQFYHESEDESSNSLFDEKDYDSKVDMEKSNESNEPVVVGIKDSCSESTKLEENVSVSSSPVDSRYVPSKNFTCNRDHRRSAAGLNLPTGSEFDVRMIDFAHTTFSSGSSTDGFTLGLENLIRLLNNIRGRGRKTMARQKEPAAELPTSSRSKKRRRSSGHDSHEHSENHAHHRLNSKKESILGTAYSDNLAAKLSEHPFLLDEETVLEAPSDKDHSLF